MKKCKMRNSMEDLLPFLSLVTFRKLIILMLMLSNSMLFLSNHPNSVDALSIPVLQSCGNKRHKTTESLSVTTASTTTSQVHHQRQKGTQVLASSMYFADTVTQTKTVAQSPPEKDGRTKVLDKVHGLEGSCDDNVITVQILMSDTGGGHRASALALRDAFNKLYGPDRFSCDIVDLYTDYGPCWPYNEYVSLYKFLAKYPILWDIVYRFGASPFGMFFNEKMLEFICTQSFTECIQRPHPYQKQQNEKGDAEITAGRTQNRRNKARRADVIISVHPLTQHVPLQIVSRLDRMEFDKGISHVMNKRMRKTPFVTVVTDLGSAHPTWFHQDVTKCFVPSTVLYKYAIENRGLDPEKVVQHGLPVRKGFWRKQQEQGPLDMNEIEQQKLFFRQRLGLFLDIPTVLVVGGGDGMGGLVNIAKALGTKLGRHQEIMSSTSNFAAVTSTTTKYQMIVICGTNSKAKQELERYFDKSAASDGTRSGIKVGSCSTQIMGYVSNMDEYMKASDVLVTKAGPGTIAEASICGLPCMLFSFLPGQEEGNVPFVVNTNKFGSYSSNPQVIADTVQSWLSTPEVLSTMQRAAIQTSRPDATLDIARDIAELAFDSLRQSSQTTAKNSQKLAH